MPKVTVRRSLWRSRDAIYHTNNRRWIGSGKFFVSVEEFRLIEALRHWGSPKKLNELVLQKLNKSEVVQFCRRAGISTREIFPTKPTSPIASDVVEAIKKSHRGAGRPRNARKGAKPGPKMKLSRIEKDILRSYCNDEKTASAIFTDLVRGRNVTTRANGDEVKNPRDVQRVISTAKSNGSIIATIDGWAIDEKHEVWKR